MEKKFKCKINPVYSSVYSYNRDKINSLSKKYLKSKYKLRIIYFINCLLNPNYFEWIEFAIKKIKYTDYKKLTICATVNDKIKNFILEKLGNYKNTKFVFNYLNEHEYPGIRELYRQGKKHNNNSDIFLYFHAKGITHRKHFKDLKYIRRKRIYLIYSILNKYYCVLKAFEIFKNIEKCVYSTEDGKYENREGGIAWLNFFYVRGNYLNKLETPKKTSDRYYYELWLTKKKNVRYGNYKILSKKCDKFIWVSDCYSFNIARYNIGEFWHPSKGYYFEPKKLKKK